MKSRWKCLAGGVRCVALAAALAQGTAEAVSGDVPAASSEYVLRELNKLLVADSMSDSKRGLSDPSASQPARSASEEVVMSAYVVKEPRIPRIREAIYEPPLIKFLKDGTLYENFGRRFTTRMELRFYSTDATPDDPAPSMFGNVKPRNGAQLGLSWSW